MAEDEISHYQQPLMIEIGKSYVTLNVTIVTAPAPQRAIFLFHDLAGRGDDFAPLAPRLAAAGYRVVMVDMPGRGQSARLDPQDYTTRNYAAIFMSLMKEHALPSNALLGQGWGAMLAVLFESLLKTAVTHLYLIDLPRTWSYGTDANAQLWAELNQVSSPDHAQFADRIDAKISQSTPAREDTIALARARARQADGQVRLGIDPAVFSFLQATQETAYNPGAGLTRCRAQVCLLQSEFYPMLPGPHVNGAKLALQRACSWDRPELLWPVLGAVLMDG